MASTLPGTCDEERPLVKMASLAVVGLGLLALFAGVEQFWVIFAVGFAVFVPMVRIASEQFGPDAGPDSESSGDTERDALDALRDRYARGELTDEEFERKVERLLGTESPERARGHISRDRGARDAERESE